MFSGYGRVVNYLQIFLFNNNHLESGQFMMTFEIGNISWYNGIIFHLIFNMNKLFMYLYICQLGITKMSPVRSPSRWWSQLQLPPAALCIGYHQLRWGAWLLGAPGRRRLRRQRAIRRLRRSSQGQPVGWFIYRFQIQRYFYWFIK